MDEMEAQLQEAARRHWRPDFEELSGAFRPVSTLNVDFRRFAAWPTLADYDALAASRGVANFQGLPIHFVAALPKRRRRRRQRLSEEAAGAVPYEQQIWATGAVPTRPESWHDFFNMLAWCLYPRSKAALNYRQTLGLLRGRTPEQNLLAMLDEGGVLHVSTKSDSEIHPVVFGHAIHEARLCGTRGSDGLKIPLCLDDVAAPFSAAWLAAVDARLSSLILANAVRKQ